jgi:hypothetical protein
MSIVDALLMSSAIKDKAANLVGKIPSYAAGTAGIGSESVGPLGSIVSLGDNGGSRDASTNANLFKEMCQTF